MPIRTATATGKVRNTGSTTITFAVHIGFAGAQSPKRQVTLAPGATSSDITVSTSAEVTPGRTVSAAVFLDRVSPSPAPYIASTAVVDYTEPDVLSGSLQSFTPSIGFLFASDEKEAKGMGTQGSSVPEWVPWAIGVGLLFWLMSKQKKTFASRKNPGAAYHSEEARRAALLEKTAGTHGLQRYYEGHWDAHLRSARAAARQGMPNPSKRRTRRK